MVKSCQEDGRILHAQNNSLTLSILEDEDLGDH